jgi:hypothetical protein
MSVFVFFEVCDIFRDIPILSTDVADKLHSGPSPILSPRQDIQHCLEEPEEGKMISRMEEKFL